MSRLVTKPTKWVCAQRRLRSAWASAQSDQSSLCAQWVAKDPSFLHTDSEDSDQTGRMTRLIWVFAGRTLTLLVLSRGGSYVNVKKSTSFSYFWSTVESELKLTDCAPDEHLRCTSKAKSGYEVHTMCSWMLTLVLTLLYMCIKFVSPWF